MHGDQMGAFAHSVRLFWHACTHQARIDVWLVQGDDDALGPQIPESAAPLSLGTMQGTHILNNLHAWHGKR